MFQKNWQDLIKPKRLEIDDKTLSENFGKFSAEPLERGFGITIGNSLRRILLSSVQGSAVTSVRIDGVLHEFSTITGVREDVTDIVLNLKEVRVRCSEEGPHTATLEAKGDTVVTAADINLPPGVEVMNPTQHIATLSKDGKLLIDMTIGTGRGYVSAEDNKVEDDSVGTIPLDAAFSPIRKVNYSVTNARVGQRTDYDRLALEVLTDGSVRPDDALAYAARILQDQLGIFLNFEEQPEEEVTQQAAEEELNENLFKPVEELELSVRAANCLQNADLKYVGELIQRNENDMLKTKNFGRKSLNEIKELLLEMGLSLGRKLESFPDREELERRRLEKERENA